MSTYYAFVCEPCQRRGGFFSRQAWGWGNFDIIESFKFLAQHLSSCGTAGIRVASEHERGYEYEPQPWQEFVAQTAAFFPRSNDWEFMATPGIDLKTVWAERAEAAALDE